MPDLGCERKEQDPEGRLSRGLLLFMFVLLL